MIAGDCPPGRYSWDIVLKTRTVEVGVAFYQVKDWIKDVKAMVAARRACFPILGVYLRFTAASNSALGDAAGRDTVVFEIHIPQTSSPSLEPSSDIYRKVGRVCRKK